MTDRFPESAVYRALLRLFPATYREVYGDEMARVFARMRADVAGDGPRTVALWLRAVLDLVRCALPIRWAALVHWRPKPRQTGGDFMLDIRYAIRGLRQRPGYASAVIVTLALGIGAITAIFSVINGVILQPLPYHRDSQLMLIQQHRAGTPNTSFSPMELEELRHRTEAFDELVEYHSLNFTLLGRGEPVRVQSGVVSWQFFQMLGVQPAVGRLFLSSDDVPTAEPVLLLSYRFWQDHFGGDSTIVGETVRMNDKVHTVVGVLPPFPHYPRENDVYMPTVACPFRPNWIPNRAARALSVFGRLRDTANQTQAEEDLRAIAHQMQMDAPDAYPADPEAHQVIPVRLKTELTRDASPTLLVLMGAVSLLLLISCANVANLMWARLSHRRRELAVRSALGASRYRLTRQLATESVITSLVGGALGLVIAYGGHQLLIDFAARMTQRAHEIEIDRTVLAFAFIVSVATGLIFGTVRPPETRGGLGQTLRDLGNRSGMLGRGTVRYGLVVSQIALSFMLLIGAGLSIRSFARLSSVDAGVNDEGVLTMTLAAAFGNDVDPLPFTENLIREVSAEPGVESVALTSSFPLDQVPPFSNTFEIRGQTIGDSTDLPQADFRVVSPSFFGTVGQTLLEGRGFSDADRGRETPPVAIVNRTFAETQLKGQDPLGSQLRVRIFGLTDRWVEIVGVVSDTRQNLMEETHPEIYFSKLQLPSAFNRLLVRTAGEPLAFAPAIRRIVNRLAPDIPVADVRTLDEVRRASIASPRTTTALLTIFAIIALIISATGTAGVIGFAVSRRTNEIGIRMALGADRTSVLGLFVSQGLRMVGIGLGLGLAGALAFNRLMQNLLFGIGGTDPLTYALVGTLLVLVAVGSIVIPARRAAAVDPLQALRTE